MDINYELYKVFYHVAVTLSFSEASKQLFISQSAVSQSIKVLEKKLNQPLFIRSTKKVQLTPEGEILLKHIEPAMNLIKKGENQLLEAHTLNGGQLRIGASDTICRYYLVPYLNRFHKEFPNIHIKVINQTSIECAKFLENGQADFIVANYPNSALAGSMNTRVINEFHDVFVASRSAFPLEGSRMSLEELLRYPIMMLDRKSTTSEFLHQVFQKSQLDLKAFPSPRQPDSSWICYRKRTFKRPLFCSVPKRPNGLVHVVAVDHGVGPPFPRKQGHVFRAKEPVV